MCFRSRILCVVFSFIVALVGLLPIRLLRLIVTTFLGKFWSATAVDAVCSHLVKVKVCLVIDWWSWLLRSYNIFRKVINFFFSCTRYFLLSRSFYQCSTDLTILPLSNRVFFVSVCVNAHICFESFPSTFHLCTCSTIPCEMSSLWQWQNSER